MINSKRSWLIAALLAVTGSEICHGDLLFGDGGTHVVSTEINDVIGIFDGLTGPTTVIFNDGAAVTETDGFDDTVYVVQNSIAIINGGTFADDVSAYNRARIEINDGLFGDDLYATNGATMIVRGGLIVDDVEAAGNSSISIFGGTFGEDIEALGGSIQLRGGNFAADTRFRARNGGELTLIGSGFKVDGAAVDFGTVSSLTGRISGTLADGTRFQDLLFDRAAGTGALGTITLTATPEPSSLALVLCLAFPTVVPRRSRRSFT